MKKAQISVVFALAFIAAFVVARFDRLGQAPVEAQQTPISSAETDALRETIGNFFENLSDPNKGARKAVDDFLKNSALSENEKVKTRIVDGLKTINSNLGAYVSYEHVGQKNVGSDILVFRYLYKCQDYPIVWYFTYYRPSSKSSDAPSSPWTLIGFRYDANLDAALLDATFN